MATHGTCDTEGPGLKGPTLAVPPVRIKDITAGLQARQRPPSTRGNTSDQAGAAGPPGDNEAARTARDLNNAPTSYRLGRFVVLAFTGQGGEA